MHVPQWYHGWPQTGFRFGRKNQQFVPGFLPDFCLGMRDSVRGARVSAAVVTSAA
jgi:hypothetical protein